MSYSSNLHDRTQQRSLLQFTLYLYIEEQKSVLANQKEKSISKLLSWYETFSFYFCFSRISFWQKKLRNLLTVNDGHKKVKHFRKYQIDCLKISNSLMEWHDCKYVGEITD